MEVCLKPSISIPKNLIFNCGSGKSWASGVLRGFLKCLEGFFGLSGPFWGKMEERPKPSISVLKIRIFNCGSGNSWASGYLGGFVKPFGGF